MCACVCVCVRERERERERERDQYTTVCTMYPQHISTHNASPHPVYNKLAIPERFIPIVDEITVFV